MTGTLKIGRDSNCDFVADAPSVSRHHADMVVDNIGRIMIRDKGSTNGLYLRRDGQVQKVDELTLSPDDVVIFGDHPVEADKLAACVRERLGRQGEKPPAPPSPPKPDPKPANAAGRRPIRRRDPKTNQVI